MTYTLAAREIPSGEGVLHRCDNPPCCRPSHLFTGTQRANVADMVAKGRHANNPARGSAVKTARLTEDQVLEMRRRRQKGEQLKSLAGAFNTSLKNVKSIVYGKAWKHVPMPT